MPNTPPRAYRARCPVGYCRRSMTGTGKHIPKKCGNCGASLTIEHGVWIVTEWRADNRYRLADAVATYARLSSAERKAERLGDYVVRFVHIAV